MPLKSLTAALLCAVSTLAWAQDRPTAQQERM